MYQEVLRHTVEEVVDGCMRELDPDVAKATFEVICWISGRDDSLLFLRATLCCTTYKPTRTKYAWYVG